MVSLRNGSQQTTRALFRLRLSSELGEEGLFGQESQKTTCSCSSTHEPRQKNISKMPDADKGNPVSTAPGSGCLGQRLWLGAPIQNAEPAHVAFRGFSTPARTHVHPGPKRHRSTRATSTRCKKIKLASDERLFPVAQRCRSQKMPRPVHRTKGVACGTDHTWDGFTAAAEG